MTPLSDLASQRGRKAHIEATRDVGVLDQVVS